MESSKDIADGRHVNPFEAVQAEQVLVSTGLVLLVDDKVSRGHGQNRQKAEEDVGDE